MKEVSNKVKRCGDVAVSASDVRLKVKCLLPQWEEAKEKGDLLVRSDEKFCRQPFSYAFIAG
jgi:hypothetical protein